MSKNNGIKKIFSNNKYFELPPSKLACNFQAHSFSFVTSKHYLKEPSIYLVNKTCTYDKFLVSHALVGNFVFLRHEIINKVHNNMLSLEDIKEINNLTETLKEHGYSIVIFPEKDVTLFGKSSILPLHVTDFLCDFNLDINFFFLVNTYFCHPIWAKSHRHCNCRYVQQFTLTVDEYKNSTPQRRNDQINDHIPSSASVYATKYPIHIKGGKLAENIETLMYACPKCNELFSVYSEYNCLKCKECGSAIEFSSDGKILLSNTIEKFDDIPLFLYETLKSKTFNETKPITKYNKVYFANLLTGSSTRYANTLVEIFPGKLHIKNSFIDEIFNIYDIKDFHIIRNNTAVFEIKNHKFALIGKNKENFYIIKDLYKLCTEI